MLVMSSRIVQLFTWEHVHEELTVMICSRTHTQTGSHSHAKNPTKKKKKSSQVLKYSGLREIKMVLVLEVKYNHSWRNNPKN